jgi:hypothetical protein
MSAHMTDRCVNGDIAIIIRDEVGCEANIGRIVLVMGLRRVLPTRGTIWRIQPVNGTTMTYHDDATGTIVVGRAIGIDHADAWLLPIRPGDNDDAIDAAHDLPIPEVLEVA